MSATTTPDQSIILVQNDEHGLPDDTPEQQGLTNDDILIKDAPKDELSTINDNDKANELHHQAEQPPPKATNRRQARVKQRRGHKYQTHDLIREISPKPEHQVVLISKEDETVTKRLEEVLVVNPDGASGPASEVVEIHQINLLSDHSSSTAILNGRRTVQCNICQRHMTESRLANHIRLLHVETGRDGDENTKRKEFRCEYCGKSYAIKYTFDQHVRTHTEGRPKCPECGSTFASAFSLFRHRAKSHNIEHNYTTHACDQCDKIFFSSSELTLHKQRHSSEKVHTCLVCKKGFSAKGNLRIHMRTHAKEKLYKCDICDNSFSHPYSLVSHRRIHTNEFPFTCSECGKSYRSKHQLSSHKNVHSDNRPYGCDQCDKTFRSRTAFKMHQDQHNGIKRFSCKFCDRKFQCHANKAKHERRHLGVKRFKCDDCDKAFIEKQELKNHQKVHAKNDTKKISNDKQACSSSE
uniref:Zinc finger protein 28 n=1 Tax=Aceria tosichella TaxID=561515 RepID=A0A6G1SHB3_9ACAR